MSDSANADDNDDNNPATIDLLALATAVVACTVPAAAAVVRIHQRCGARSKADGSIVTDADYAAQNIIVNAVRQVSDQIRIVGEEEDAETARKFTAGWYDDSVWNRTREEIQERRRRRRRTTVFPLHHDYSADTAESSAADPIPSDTDDGIDWHVDAHRVSVIVDPLDGTKSYAEGEYECVSILIGIVLDGNNPILGVVGKPFGYTECPPVFGSEQCVTIYGGTLLKGVFVAGVADPLPALADVVQTETNNNNEKALPRAVVSSSRSAGETADFCNYLSAQGILADSPPLLVSGAGEKSVWVIFRRQNAQLWFFPKAGTFRWDVAAPDAILRALGGCLTDRHGQTLDYSVDRDHAENDQGVVCCLDPKLHETCLALYREWREERQDA